MKVRSSKLDYGKMGQTKSSPPSPKRFKEQTPVSIARHERFEKAMRLLKGLKTC